MSRSRSRAPVVVRVSGQILAIRQFPDLLASGIPARSRVSAGTAHRKHERLWGRCLPPLLPHPGFSLSKS